MRTKPVMKRYIIRITQPQVFHKMFEGGRIVIDQYPGNETQLHPSLYEECISHHVLRALVDLHPAAIDAVGIHLRRLDIPFFNPPYPVLTIMRTIHIEEVTLG